MGARGRQAAPGDGEKRAAPERQGVEPTGENLMMKIPKETLGLAGEFAVASELCKRGVYAQLTLGNRKRTDLLIESDARMLRIQVKSKQGPTWPAVKGITGDDIFLVFVDFHKKDPLQRPDFYLLSSKDWARFVERELVKTGLVSEGKFKLSSENVPTGRDGFVGMSVSAKQLADFKEEWHKIEQRVV